jgi:restriction endonuclease S subunit
LRYPAYRKYKPSGVDWLDGVPEHWRLTKATHGFGTIGSGTTPRSDATDYYEGTIPWVTTSELRETVITETKQSLTADAIGDYPTLQTYPVGTLLFAMYGATIGRMGILGIPATVNQACCAFGWPTQLNPKFAFYWLWMRRPVLISLSNGGGQPNLSQDDLRNIRIPAPPLQEQQAIVNFLDRKTAEIDALVAKKRALIEKLKEKRFALISRAVTRGLPLEAARVAGPDSPSDVGPEHWRCSRLKHVCRFVGGGTPDTEKPEFWDGNIPWVSPKDMKSFEIFDTADHITAAGLRTSATQLIEPGAVLLVVRSGILRHSVPVAINRVAVTLNQDMRALITSDEIVPRYLARFIEGNQQQLLHVWSKEGATVESLESNWVANTQLRIPPKEIQRAIADFLDRETAKIDSLVAKVEQAIERLQEYRTALITAAVTGKIDVRAESGRSGLGGQGGRGGPGAGGGEGGVGGRDGSGDSVAGRPAGVGAYA